MSDQPVEMSAEEVEAVEVAKLDASPDVPSREELADGAELVAGVIASPDGGVNGLNPYMLLSVTNLGDGALSYILTDRETGEEQRFLVTITPDEG